MLDVLGEVTRVLINTAVSAGWMILIVLILRLLVKRRAPRWVTCLLWGLCGLRLVWFIRLPSPLSLLPTGEVLPEGIGTAASPAVRTGAAPVDDVVNGFLGTHMTPAVGASVNPMQIAAAAAGLVWVVGALVLLTVGVVSSLRLRRRLACAVRAEAGDVPAGLPDGVLRRDGRLPCGASVFLCESVDAPFILGVFRPRVYLPFGMDEETRRQVLTHEAAHLSRLDHVTKLLSFALLCVYWFSPLVWLAYVLYARDVEIACDERVLRRTDDAGRTAYASALLDVGTQKRVHAVTPLAFGEVGVKTRIRSALSYKKPLLWVLIAALLAAAVLCVCFFTSPDEKGETSGGFYLPGVRSSHRDPAYPDADVQLLSLERDGSGPFVMTLRVSSRAGEDGAAFTVLPEWSLTYDESEGPAILLGEATHQYVPAGEGTFTLPDGEGLLKPQLSVDVTLTIDADSLEKSGVYRLTLPLEVPADGTDRSSVTLVFRLERGWFDFQPSPMPDDFAVSLKWKTGDQPNVFDTFKGVVTKDLISAVPPSASCRLTLTDAERAELWKLVDYYGVIDVGVDQRARGGICVDPNTDYTLVVRANGRKKTIAGNSAGYIESGTAEGTREQASYYACVSGLMQFTYATDEWCSLPEVQGGYD